MDEQRFHPGYDAAIGQLGYPLGSLLAVRGEGGVDPSLRNPFLVRRVGKYILEVPLLLEARGDVGRLAPGRQRSFFGFESVEWLGCPPGVDSFVPAADRRTPGEWFPLNTFVVVAPNRLTQPPPERGKPLKPADVREPVGVLGYPVGTFLMTEGSISRIYGHCSYLVERVEGARLSNDLVLEWLFADEDETASGRAAVDGYEIASFGRYGWDFGFRPCRIRSKPS